jgi:hypothetical protein
MMNPMPGPRAILKRGSAAKVCSSSSRVIPMVSGSCARRGHAAEALVVHREAAQPLLKMPGNG